MVNFDFDHGQISFLIGADYFCVVLHSGRIILQPDSNAIGFLDHMAIGDDIALGIHYDSRTQRVLTDGAITLRASKEAVKEIIEGVLLLPLLVFLIATTAAAVRILDGGFGVDVYHRGF